MDAQTSEERLSVVVAGHVDHGKSTVIGRMLADTGSLPQGKLEQVKATCQRNAKPFEYAFLLDALKDEQAQGITIDAARCFFHTGKRHYILIDAPGHIEFLKNMITGAARAEAVVLVIDACEGIQENSKRHGYMVSMLGVRQLVVVVNKMDLVDYDRATFEAIRQEYLAFLSRIGLEPLTFIPVSGTGGANIVERSPETPWYEGPTLLEQMDAFAKPELPTRLPFRFPVQDVYRFTEAGDDRRILAGTVETGAVRVGDEVVFYPSRKGSKVASVERFNAPARPVAEAGEAIGFTLTTQVYVKPGELMCRAADPPPQATTRFRANMFWMGHAPMIPKKNYKLKLGSVQSPITLVRTLSVLDASELSTCQTKNQVDRHDVAECLLECPKPVAYDVVTDLEQTARFVIIDNYEIAGAGIILESILDEASTLKEHQHERERHWKRSAISTRERVQRYKHRAKFVVIVGRSEPLKEDLAKELEKRLFTRNLNAYYLGMSNIVRGLDADLRAESVRHDDHIRRLGELARIMTDAGQIFITSIEDADQYDLRTLQLLNSPNDIVVVSVGPNGVGDYQPDLSLDADADVSESVGKVCELLREREVILEYYI